MEFANEKCISLQTHEIHSGPLMDRKLLSIVFLTVALDLVGFGILIPIQPFFALSFGAAPTLITMLGASYSLMQFLFMPMWGRLSDHFGRRPIMLISIAMSALGFLLFSYADSLIMLFISRMISGFGGGNIGCAQAIIADTSDDKDLIKGMGLVGTAIGLGFVIGPAIGGFFGAYGFTLPAQVSFLLSSINFFLAAVFLRETRWLKSREVSTRRQIYLFSALTRDKTSLRLMCLSFLIIMAFSLFEQSIGMFIDAQFSMSDGHLSSIKRTAIFLVIIAIVSAIVQIGFLKRLAHFFGEERLLMIGTVLNAFSLVTMSYIDQQFIALFLPGITFGIGMGICLPCLSTLVSHSANANEQATRLAESQSYCALGRIVGPALCGYIFEFAHHGPFIIGAGVMIMGGMIAKDVGEWRRKSETPTSARAQ